MQAEVQRSRFCVRPSEIDHSAHRYSQLPNLLKACFNQSTNNSDADTIITGVNSVSTVVIAKNKGMNEVGKIEKGDDGEPESSNRLRTVITVRKRTRWDRSTM
ncbi:4737_t:CDS:2 [Scutellospora calospora]|uniref:4737_t:CDS:1 n=1 Tax=Scutellospora calospora TaxID=85575 RepID=A0ACA9LYD7_9GLOM|nr:4737_t:CDS:2 [Scutellospora calospora]